MSWTSRQFNGPQTATYAGQSNSNSYNGSVRYEYKMPSHQPSNLSNSAVHKMLNESQTSGSSMRKEVLWPPPADDYDFEEEYEQSYSHSQHSQTGHNGYHSKKPSKPFEPPPTTIPLKASVPITQTMAPIYKAEPIAQSYRGGRRMRGDQKWPPPECKARIEEEKQAAEELARGPAYRPAKVQKDYSSFFAKNAIPNTYPGYKAPPGTQHFDEYENGHY